MVNMAVKHDGSGHKWLAVSLCLLTLLVSFVVIFVLKSSTKTGGRFALQNTEADINQSPANTNPQSGQERKAAADKKVSARQHTHPAFSERSRQRATMVDKQIEARGVHEPNVLSSLRTVPRHAFVSSGDLTRAYSDQPLAIGLGQTISQPYIVAYMTEALGLGRQHKVLEVGTGSGYQAAVCAEIVRQVYTVEILEELAESARQRLKGLGYKNVFVKAGDGYFGWKEKGPFDAIIVTCAAGFVPPPLIKQLKPGGKMILPVGNPFGNQTLVLISKDDRDKIHGRRLLPVRFVPMRGRIEKKK